MSVIVLVELEVSEDRLDDVTPLFETLLGGTRARQGNEGVTVHVDELEAAEPLGGRIDDEVRERKLGGGWANGQQDTADHDAETDAGHGEVPFGNPAGTKGAYD